MYIFQKWCWWFEELLPKELQLPISQANMIRTETVTVDSNVSDNHAVYPKGIMGDTDSETQLKT
jgi:hypothetical protein